MKIWFFLLLLFGGSVLKANHIFIPMDATQTNHLKAYGTAYQSLKNGYDNGLSITVGEVSYFLLRQKRVRNAC